jgi:hypothetical protein
MTGALVMALLLLSGGTKASSHCDVTVSAGQNIQDDGVSLATAGQTVCVEPGIYTGNVIISDDISLISTEGSGVTTIEGVANQGQNGAIVVVNNTSGVQIGDEGHGFTIIGFDGPTAGLETATVYFQGSHSNAIVAGNNIVANGDGGLLTEFGATISEFVISGNEFSGQTFVGSAPAGDGFADQFTVPNVPRQLVAMGGGIGGGNTSDITFTDNLISGVAGGINADGNEQGNNLVTIDSVGTVISGNEFTGFTNRFAHSLRTRGPDNEITNNRFAAGSPVGLWVNTVDDDTTTVLGNCFEGNAVGLFNQGSAVTPATGNWWGDASGPGGEGPGSGDPVSSNVDYDPWLTDGCPLDPPPPAPENPESKNDCKKGGWEAFGFKNQGQCIKFVNTGKDSR